MLLLSFLLLAMSSLECRCGRVRILINNVAVNSTQQQRLHAPSLTLEISHHNTSFAIDLQLNKMLMAASYREKVITSTGSYYRNNNQSEEFCYYVGAVKGVSDSSAAFTSCPRLNGYVRLNEKTWHISDDSEGGYDITIESNNRLATWYRNISNLEKKIWNNVNSTKKRLRRTVQANFFDNKLTVELYIVADKAMFEQYSKDINKITNFVKSTVNNANLLYQTVGIHVLLVGMEVWTERDQISVVSDSGATLDGFYSYRLMKITTYNDNGYFMSGIMFNGGVLGLAQVGSMCSSRGSGGLLRSIKDRSDVTGAILAHEIGHNFGLRHDESDCECESQRVGCIMASSASTSQAGVHFSSCSKRQLESIETTGFDLCLHNTPHTLDRYLAVCDNGILEDGEECDCGRLPRHLCNPACCVGCKLQSWAKCSQGQCCDVPTCTLKPRDMVCRSQRSFCDIAEVCDGLSSSCSADITLHQGHDCTVANAPGYCFDGECQNRNRQCNSLYKENARDGIEGCYKFNEYGSSVGYCEKKIVYNVGVSSEYTSCEAEHRMCGVLQCDVKKPEGLVKNFNYFLISTKRFNLSPCVSAVFDVGTDTADPAIAPNGSPCGPNKLCWNRKCIPKDFVFNTNPCPPCIKGKCGNDGVCHCDPGYSGASCDPGSSLPFTPTSVSPPKTTFNSLNNTNNGLTKTPIKTTFLIVIGIAFFFLILLAVFAYDCTHKRRLVTLFKRNKNVVANRKETIKPQTAKTFQANNMAYDDREYTEIYNAKPADVMALSQGIEYANQSEVVEDSEIYSYNQSPSRKLEIINANVTTPPSSFPPQLDETPFYQPRRMLLLQGSRQSLMPANLSKPPVPDASLKPVVAPRNLPAASKPTAFGPAIQPISPTRSPASPNGDNTRVNLFELNNNPVFDRIKRQLAKQQSNA